MDDESGESMELMEEMPLKEMGEAELERLVRGWRRGEIIPVRRLSSRRREMEPMYASFNEIPSEMHATL